MHILLGEQNSGRQRERERVVTEERIGKKKWQQPVVHVCVGKQMHAWVCVCLCGSEAVYSQWRRKFRGERQRKQQKVIEYVSFCVFVCLHVCVYREGWSLFFHWKVTIMVKRYRKSPNLDKNLKSRVVFVWIFACWTLMDAALRHINHIWNTSTIIQSLGVILIIHSGTVTTHQLPQGWNQRRQREREREGRGRQSNEGTREKKHMQEEEEEEDEGESHKEKTMLVKC